MKVYLLTAAGVIFLSVIVSLLIPEGKLHKSVTFVMRLICIFVLMQPIAGLFNIKETNDAWTDDFFNKQYVCDVYSEHQSEQLEILLQKQFEVATDCDIKVEYVEGEFKPTEVGVELNENNGKLIEEIYAYLDGLGYINITVYAKSS